MREKNEKKRSQREKNITNMSKNYLSYKPIGIAFVYPLIVNCRTSLIWCKCRCCMLVGGGGLVLPDSDWPMLDLQGRLDCGRGIINLQEELEKVCQCSLCITGEQQMASSSIASRVVKSLALFYVICHAEIVVVALRFAPVVTGYIYLRARPPNANNQPTLTRISSLLPAQESFPL